jgi:hypothetical protein
MIRPKYDLPRKPTKAEESDAYELCTLRDRGACVRCGWASDCQRDHRQNRQSGNTVVSNLHLLCGPFAPDGGCHLWKGMNPEQAVADGFAVPRYADPAQWPGRRLIAGALTWVQYGNAGEITPLTDDAAKALMNGNGREF